MYLLVLILALGFCTPAFAYTFPGDLPPGCSGNNGSYTCGALNLSQSVTFTDAGNVNITVNGDMQTNGINIGSASQAANVTFNISAYSPRVDILSSGTVYANFNITTTSSLGNIDIVINGSVVISGNITAAGQDHLDFDMYDSAIVNGDVDLYGPDASIAELHNNATVNGYLHSRSDDNDDGPVTLYDSGSTVNGDVQAYGDIVNSGVITGCAQITNDTYTFARMYLYSGSSTNAICKGEPGACQASSDYLLYNNTGSTPPNCAAVPAPLIAEYHLDAESWDGTNNEVKDTADYVTAPFDGQGIGSPLPSASDASPAHAGTTGTCGYANFSGSSDGSAFTLDNLPTNSNSDDKTSVSLWMYWDGSSQAKIVVGFDTYYLLFKDGDFGFGSAASDLYGISASGLANGWHHVVGVFSDSNVINSQLYIDGVLQTLTQRSGSPYNIRAQVTNLITVGGTGFTNAGRFDGGYIDEVKVYNGAVTQTQVTADFTATHKCIYPAPADNIAPSATLSSSNVLKGWDNINGVKDNITPTSSHYFYGGYDGDNPRVYANCCTHGAQDWLEFAWPTAKKLTDFQVFWWDEEFKGGSVALPTSAFVEYWDGSAWVNVGEVGKARHQFNSLPLNNIITTKIRVTVQNSKIVGIIEVRILGEDAPELIAEYHLDEASWSGTAGEVLDSSGNGYHGNAINSATTAFSDRAIAGTNGTCAYGVFDGAGKAVLLPTTFPRLKDSVSMTFWVKRLGNPEELYSRLFADDTSGSYGYGVKLNNDGSLNYFKRGSGGDKQSGNGVILTVGEWYFVALTVDDATDSLTFYTYDQSGTLLNTVTHSGYTDTYTSYAPTGQGASIGALRNGQYPFNGELDELRLYSGALTQAEVDAIRQETHPCSAYVTNVNAAGFNCIAGMESDVADGHLYTQLVNTPFRVKVIALNDDSPPIAETSFSAASNRTAVLRFKDQVTDNYINFNGGDTANSKNVVFTTANTTGVVEVTGISIPQSYKTLGCSVEEVSVSPASDSSDTFTVRPYAFILSSTDANADSNGTNAATDPNAAITAGNTFNLTATAVRSATVTDVDVGYNGTPTPHSTMNHASYHKVVQHVGGVKHGELTGVLNQAEAGVAAGNFTYDEVGYFKLNQYAFIGLFFYKG